MNAKGADRMDIEDLKFIMAQGEGYNLEFKESFSDATGKEICAFANAKGGKILVGVTDDGEVKGVKSSNQLKSRIYDMTRNFDPPLRITVEEVGPVLLINVEEGVNKPYSVNGRFYIRYGANSQQLKRDEIRDFFREENLISFDDKINNEFDLANDLDEDKFEHFLKITKISPVITKEKILGNLGLIKDDHIKNAGILLFSRKITRFFLNATLSCFLYMGTSKYKILDKKEFDEDILSNYNNAIKYLTAHLNTEYIIKSGPREEKLELPEDALREAVLNAVAHRDYFSTANIHVNIFKDRVEIINPGGLAGNLSIDDLYEKSIPRNPLLFGLMERMELVEKAGSGLVRIEKAMLDYKLDKPEIKADRNWFHITFKRPELQKSTYEDRFKKGNEKRGKEKKGNSAPENAPVNAPVKLSKLQSSIIGEMKRSEGVTYETLSEFFRKDRATIKRNIQKLKKMNIVKRIGSDKSGYWKVENL